MLSNATERLKSCGTLKRGQLQLFPFFVSEVFGTPLKGGKIGELGECLNIIKSVTSRKVNFLKFC